MSRESAGQEARALLQSAQEGVLSTHSQELPGYPFGSVLPFCLNEQGQPLVLISSIAQHTRNLRADPRASLIVLAGGDDIQAAARLTLVGDFAPVAEAALEAAAARYYRYFPQAQDYHRTHDFSFWSLSLKRLRFIGGFGRIHWLEPEQVLQVNPFAAEREASMVQHMNEDHGDALSHYCVQAGIAVPAGISPVMAGLDAEGMHLRLGSRIVRIPFPQAVATPLAVRETLVAMARAGR